MDRISRVQFIKQELNDYLERYIDTVVEQKDYEKWQDLITTRVSINHVLDDIFSWETHNNTSQLAIENAGKETINK